MTVISTHMRKAYARDVTHEPHGQFTSTNVQDAISQSTGASPVTPGTAVNVGQSPYQVVTLDQMLLVDTSGGPVTILMQPSAARLGVDLIVKDITGNAAANPITVTMSGAETADGQSPYPLDSDSAGAKFSPKLNGYFIKP